MQRVWTALLILLGVVVLAGAVYVISDNDSPQTSTAAGTSTPAPAPTADASTASGSSTSSSPSGSSTSSTARPPVVAFLGDDWTAGDGATARGKRFTSLLSAAVDVTEANFGAAGTGYARESAGAGDYAARVQAVIAAKPAVVVVAGGRNDADLDPDTVRTAARTLFDALVDGLPDATIVVVAPFWGDSAKPARLDAVSAAVRTAAQGAGVTYLDLEDPIQGHSDFMADEADPDDQGHAAIAAALRTDLSSAVTS